MKTSFVYTVIRVIKLVIHCNSICGFFVINYIKISCSVEVTLDCKFVCLYKYLYIFQHIGANMCYSLVYIEFNMKIWNCMTLLPEQN